MYCIKMQASLLKFCHCKYLETTVVMPILLEPWNCRHVHVVNQIIGDFSDLLIGYNYIFLTLF